MTGASCGLKFDFFHAWFNSSISKMRALNRFAASAHTAEHHINALLID
jgi:hypothetical protein